MQTAQIDYELEASMGALAGTHCQWCGRPWASLWLCHVSALENQTRRKRLWESQHGMPASQASYHDRVQWYNPEASLCFSCASSKDTTALRQL